MFHFIVSFVISFCHLSVKITAHPSTARDQTPSCGAFKSNYWLCLFKTTIKVKGMEIQNRIQQNYSPSLKSKALKQCSLAHRLERLYASLRVSAGNKNCLFFFFYPNERIYTTVLCWVSFTSQKQKQHLFNFFYYYPPLLYTCVDIKRDHFDIQFRSGCQLHLSEKKNT